VCTVVHTSEELSRSLRYPFNKEGIGVPMFFFEVSRNTEIKDGGSLAEAVVLFEQ
jgi:hypothetical protein